MRVQGLLILHLPTGLRVYRFSAGRFAVRMTLTRTACEEDEVRNTDGVLFDGGFIVCLSL